MILYKFSIPIYDVNVTLCQIESKNDASSAKKALEQYKLEKEFIDEELENIKQECINGANTYRDKFVRRFFVIFYEITDDTHRVEIYGHEKRHIEDRVLEHMDINDIESAGLLAGYLSKCFFIFWNKVNKK